MTNQHPIIPPPELRCKWQSESPFKVISVEREDYMIDRAAQWGADQELEACCEWIADWYGFGCDEVIGNLRAARRPKPPSLKEESLKGFDTIANIVLDEYSGTTFYEQYKKLTDTIRRALEQLDD